MEATLRKQNILICAKNLFSEKGFHNTQISDIIKEARIARGTVYQYFKNKDDIFITLLKNYYDEWLNTVSLDTKSLDLKTISPKNYFRHRVMQTLVFLANDPHLCNIVVRIGIGLQGELGAMIKEFEQKINNLVMNDLILGVKTGNVKKEVDVELVASLISGSLLYTSYHYFVHTPDSKPVPDITDLSEKILFAYENIFV